MNTTSPNILMYKKANLGGTNNITLTKEELPFRVQFDKFMCQKKETLSNISEKQVSYRG